MPDIKDMLPLPPWEGPPVPRILMEKEEEKQFVKKTEKRDKGQGGNPKGNSGLLLIGWDGTRIPADSRADAVAKVKTYLNQWMQSGDHIYWYLQEGDKPKEPSFAQVFNEVEEDTDATVIIRKAIKRS